MKTILLLLAAFIVLHSNGTTYYFSAAGDDSRTLAQAQNPFTPWKTLDKFNSISNSLLPGDAVLFERGSTFYGSLVLLTSGNSAQPIMIGAYGNGPKPIITGFRDVTNWIPVGGNIYENDCSSCQAHLNLVTVQDTVQPIGRWPRTTAPGAGYLALQSHSGTTSITSNAIATAPSFVGGELVTRPYGWLLDRGLVTGQTATTVSYAPFSNVPYAPQDGFGFFFQNHVNTLTQTGDWMYDANTKKFRMYFGAQNPGNHSVKATTIDHLVSISGQNYINFDGISLKGANSNGFNLNYCEHIQIINCDIQFSGIDGISVADRNTRRLTVKNCTILNSNNNAITGNGSSGSVFQYNIIRNTGLIRGMGLTGDGNYNAIIDPGSKSLIEYNEIKNTGYNGIHFAGDSVIVKNNYFDSFCLVKSDGGGIYTALETGKTGRKIIGNIVLNGLGDRNGRKQSEIDNPFAGNVHGIYMDGGATNVRIEGNTVANCASSGLELSSPTNVQVINNTLYNNTFTQIYYLKSGLSFSNLTVKNNIAFSTKSEQLIAVVSSNVDDESSWGILDSNYYCRPISEPNNVDTAGYSHSPTLFDYPDGGILQAANGRFYSLDRWKIFSQQDLHTKKTPITITDVNNIRFEYNPTNTAKTIVLNTTYIDVKNQSYANTLTLAPYSSVILVRSGSVLLNQTINFPAITAKTFGDAPFTVNATASSGLPVSFAIISGPATAAGNTITLTGAGTVVVEATQPGNGTYNPATPITQNLTVLQANQVINFGSLSNKTFGDPPFAINAIASSGLPVSFRIVSGPATLLANTLTLTGIGTVVVEASQPGNANFKTAPVVLQSFNVTNTSSSCSATGSILREQWNNVFGILVSDIPLQSAPGSTSLITALETQNTGGNMGARIRGYICPPLSGNYTFYIAGDDGVELWLSTNSDPSNRVKIAGYNGWTGFREWNKYPGQVSSLINLQAGQSYYIEVFHKNGGGGDHVSVKWDLPNGTTEAPVPGSRLSPYAFTCSGTATTWTGSVSTAWEATENWTCGVPTAATDVIISGEAVVVVSSNAHARSLSAALTPNITVKSGFSLTIHH